MKKNRKNKIHVKIVSNSKMEIVLSTNEKLKEN
jgi:hypothetical protein